MFYKNISKAIKTILYFIVFICANTHVDAVITSPEELAKTLYQETLSDTETKSVIDYVQANPTLVTTTIINPQTKAPEALSARVIMRIKAALDSLTPNNLLTNSNNPRLTNDIAIFLCIKKLLDDTGVEITLDALSLRDILLLMVYEPYWTWFVSKIVTSSLPPFLHTIEANAQTLFYKKVLEKIENPAEVSATTPGALNPPALWKITSGSLCPTALWAALNLNDPVKRKFIIGKLLDNKANFSIKNCNGDFPLHAAVKANDIDTVEMLLAHGDNINKKGDALETPLLTAVLLKKSPNKHKMIRLLLEKKADLSISNFSGSTPIHYAIQPIMANPITDLEALQMLLDAGANVNVKGHLGQTPLHLAVDNGKDEKSVKMLLDHKAEVNAKSVVGETPLHVAARAAPNKSVILQLLDAGADSTIKNKLGQTPVQFAAKLRDLTTDPAQRARYDAFIKIVTEYPITSLVKALELLQTNVLKLRDTLQKVTLIAPTS